MSNFDSGEFDEATAFPGGRGGEGVIGGTLFGARWQVALDPARPRIVIDGRDVHVTPDGFGGFLTHAMFGRWYDLAELAQMIVRYHPSYSPLARRRDEPLV